MARLGDGSIDLFAALNKDVRLVAQNRRWLGQACIHGAAVRPSHLRRFVPTMSPCADVRFDGLVDRLLRVALEDVAMANVLARHAGHLIHISFMAAIKLIERNDIEGDVITPSRAGSRACQGAVLKLRR